MHSSVLDFMLARRSTPVKDLAEPAPSQEELESILKAASRVPDHGRLTPWRFILYRGDVRATIGDALAERAVEREGELPQARIEQERTRFSRAPLVIGVICVPKESPAIPEWEMFLSGGMAAMNLMIAANALGYGTNLITNWYSNDAEGRRILGLAPQERVIGFVHIGSYDVELMERPRPELATIVSDYAGPWEA
ncbi:nitroreductase [uncultured Nitratireductor sp.]|uniref:nitroreductase family protein n=1 Tax=uncultured Nitratireductor sp. TaxID=520953 RepID=UPI0025E03B3B|nr:nitroreductase [uncultured Nitratireductor sp.]